MPSEDPFEFRRLAVPVYGPSLLFGVAEGAMIPVVALSVRQLGGSVALAALIVTLMGIGSLVSNLPASLVAARWGERKAIVGAAAFGTLAMAICGFGHSIAAFAVGTFMIGMSGAVFGLARQSYLVEAVPFRYRARALSTLGGVMRIGLFIGPFAGAATIPWLGLAGAYTVGAVAMAAAAVLALRMPELPAPQEGLPAATPAKPSFRSLGASYLHVFATVGAGVVLVAAVRAARQALLPLWAERIGLDAATISLVYGVATGLEMLVFYPAGKIMDLKGRGWVAVPSMLLMGAALVAMPFTHDATTLLAAALLLGFGNGLGSGLIMTLGADHSPAVGRAHFLGLWRLMTDLGSTGGPALLSAVTALASLAAGIWAIGGLAFAAALLLGYWIPRKSRPPR